MSVSSKPIKRCVGSPGGRRRCCNILFWLVWLPWLAHLLVTTPAWSQYHLPQVQPKTAGIDAARLQLIDQLVAVAIEKQEIPGCVVLLARDGRCFYQRALGHKRLLPSPEPMTLDTVFDMASITKPVATATSVMKLVEQGKLRLSDPLGRHLPEFKQNGKDDITVFQCLTHQAGFVPDSPLAEYEHHDEIWPNLYALGTQYEPGTQFVYSDVGFQFLGKLVEQVSGQPLNEFAYEHIFQPLGMCHTRFLPPAAWQDRIAPTERRNDEWMRGEVHDPRSYAMGGVAGHAGLFSTAGDLAIYGQMMLCGGCLGDRQILAPRTVDVMTAAYNSGQVLRGLGWDKRSRYSTNRGELFTDRAFGHGGFTGTVLWVDPGLGLIVVVLSNRVHPDGQGTVNRLAGRIATVAAAAIRNAPSHRAQQPTRRSAVPIAETSCGIDVLERDQFAPLAGQRVGLILNHTSRNRNGRLTSEILQEAPHVQLVCLFSPEHGLAGVLDESHIADTQDESTGLPVYSLYGEQRTPTAAQLAKIDTLVFDIQDIGTRFYTYMATMRNAMRAAAQHKLRFAVLDRPNPIGGIVVSGPVLDAGRESFVGSHPIPVRHGMTAGELARMFRDELQLDLELDVIRIDGWQRRSWWDETGLTWINPSPNMRTPHQAILYPGIGLLETTNLSVGRGTDTPFELIGAPWIEARTLASNLNQLNLPGIRCVPISFTPSSSKYESELCHGVRFLLTDRSRFQPVRFGLAVACALRDLHGDNWELRKMDRLLCDANVLQSLQRGDALDAIAASYQAELADFMIRREAHLIYE